MNKNIFKIFIVIYGFISSGCGIYSFSGASVSPDTKTIYIDYFNNYAPIVKQALSQLLFEGLQKKFLSETSLSFTNSKENADLVITGFIKNYTITQVELTQDDKAKSARIIVEINVEFKNKKDEKQSFVSDFSRFSDFPVDKDFNEIETTAYNEITRQLINDIFTKSFVNW